MYTTKSEGPPVTVKCIIGASIRLDHIFLPIKSQYITHLEPHITHITRSLGRHGDIERFGSRQRSLEAGQVLRWSHKKRVR